MEKKKVEIEDLCLMPFNETSRLKTPSKLKFKER